MIVTANLPIFLTGALAVPLREDLTLGRAALGGAIAVVLASAAAVSSSMGALAQRWGAVRALRLSTGLTAVAALGIALASRGWLTLLPWLVLVGLGLAIAESAGNLLLHDRVRIARHGSVFGIKQAAPPLAAMLAGLTVPVVAEPQQWRFAYAVAAVLSLANLLLLPSPEPPRERRSGPPGRVRRHAPLILLSAGLGCGFAASNSVATFLVDSAVTQGVPAARAGLYLTAASLMAVGTRLFVGRLADGRSVEQVFATVVGMLLLGTLGYLTFATGDPGLVLLGALLTFGVGYGWSGLSFLAVTRVATRAPAAASGVVLTGAFIGGLIGPVATGAMADTFGYPVSWTVLAGVNLLGATLIFFANRWIRRVGDGIAN